MISQFKKKKSKKNLKKKLKLYNLENDSIDLKFVKTLYLLPHRHFISDVNLKNQKNEITKIYNLRFKWNNCLTDPLVSI